MCKVILQGVSIFLGGSLDNNIYLSSSQGVAYTTPRQAVAHHKLYTLLFIILLYNVKLYVIIRYKISDAVCFALNICGAKVEKMKLKDFTKEQQALMKRGGVVYDMNDGYDYCIHNGRIFRTEHDNDQTMWEDVTNDSNN